MLKCSWVGYGFKTYSSWIDHVKHRSDLTYAGYFGGETSIGPPSLEDYPEVKVEIGLLGADLAIENGKYRIKKIYTGESWNSDLSSPLSGPVSILKLVIIYWL
jgi:tricorn protease